MSINPLSNFGNIPGVTAGQTGSATVADNFDMFLQILTTQLKNQNPLEPLDTNEFTQQLVQFSSVEQAVKQNSQLETLNKLISASASANAVSYIGTSITAQGTVNYLRGGSAEWTLGADRAGAAEIVIKDAAGSTVKTVNMNLDSGPNQFVWDGKSTSGSALPEGRYTITVTAKDANGADIGVQTRLKAKVDAVDFSTGEPVLQIGDMYVPLSLVESVTGYNG